MSSRSGSGLFPFGEYGNTTIAFISTLSVVLGLFGYLFAISYQGVRHEAQVTVGNLAKIIATDIEGSLDRAQSDIRVFVPQVTADDLSGHASEERRRDIESRMALHLQTFPAVTNYRVFNAQGRTVFGAGSAHPEATFSVADREWFLQLRDDPGRDLVLSEVVVGKGTHNQTMIMGVAIRDGDPSFSLTSMRCRPTSMLARFSRLTGASINNATATAVCISLAWV